MQVNLAAELSKRIELREDGRIDEDFLRSAFYPSLEAVIPMGLPDVHLLEAVYQMIREHAVWVAASRSEQQSDQLFKHADIATEELAKGLLRPDMQEHLGARPQRLLRLFLTWARKDHIERRERLAWWFRLQTAIHNEGSLTPVPNIRAF